MKRVRERVRGSDRARPNRKSNSVILPGLTQKCGDVVISCVKLAGGRPPANLTQKCGDVVIGCVKSAGGQEFPGQFNTKVR